MRNFWALLNMQNQKLIMYRADMIIWGVSGIIQPAIALLVWSTFMSSGIKASYTHPDIVVYFLAVMFASSVTSVWSSYFVNMEINDGGAARYLIKPVTLFQEHFAWNIGEKVYKIAISIILITLFSLFNLKIVGQFEFNWINLTLSSLSLIAALFIHFYFDLIVGIMSFWTHDNDFLRNLNFAFSSLFAGVVIPVIFLPSLLKDLAILLPYRYTLGFPAEVLLNKLSTGELVLGISIQAFWLITCIFGYQYLYQKGIKVYQGYGS